MNKTTLLARWLAGELTEAELREFQKTEDYAVYAKIAEKATQLSLQILILKNHIQL